MAVTPHALVGGRYRPSEQLAVGGMGEIWRGEDTLLGRPVAIKVLRADHASDADFRERFRAEARHAAVLTQPNVTQVFDYVDDGTGSPYIVMEYVAGEPLSALLERQGPLDAEQTWSILGQTAAALDAAHRVGIVHRDIKPANILVCPDGLVKVTDFGIARAYDEAAATHPGIVLGTARYLAPEQLEGEKATPESDMYALGVVGYECLAGHPPFRGETPDVLHAHQVDDPPALPAGVPRALADLVLALLAKDPASRPRDAGAIAAQAARMAGRQPVDDVAADSAPLEPYPSELDPATRVLAVDGPASRPTAEPTSAIATDEPPTDGSRDWRNWREWREWRELRLIGREHPTALAVGVLAALLLAATLLTTRALSIGHARHATPRPTHSSASPTARALAVSGVTLAGGGDHPEELRNVTDSSPASAWYTEHYASASFGGLKSGTGLVLHVSGTSATTVVIRFADPGVAAKLYAGGSARGKAVAVTSSAPREWRVTLPAQAHARTWLLWITRLVPDSGGYRAGVADVRFMS